MKKICKFLVLTFVLLKVTGPGTIVYYGINSTEVKEKEQAMQFEEIAAAYKVQQTANTWSIDVY